MQFQEFSFGSIRIDGTNHKHDVVIDRGKVRKRKKKPSKHQEEEFVIGGYTAPEGARQHFGAPLLGSHDHGRLYYVGKVGSGFSQATLASLARALKPLVRMESPFIDAPRERRVIYVAPKLVAQVAFEEWTEDRKLRQPVFLGLRDDKKPEECLLPDMISSLETSF